MTESIVVYEGQTYRRTLDFSLLATDDDSLFSASDTQLLLASDVVSLTDNDEMTPRGEVVSTYGIDDLSLLVKSYITDPDKLNVDFAGVSAGGPFTVEVYIETEANRAMLLCYSVTVEPLPACAPIALSYKPGGRGLYQLEYAHRLVDNETLAAVVVDEDYPDVSIGTSLAETGAVLMGVGVARIVESGVFTYDIHVRTSDGRVFTDCIKLVVGGCGG